MNINELECAGYRRYAHPDSDGLWQRSPIMSAKSFAKMIINVILLDFNKIREDMGPHFYAKVSIENSMIGDFTVAIDATSLSVKELEAKCNKLFELIEHK